MEDRSVVTGEVIKCAIAVHKALGPRLRESTYEEALAIEFLDQGVSFERQVSVPVQYKGHWVGHYRIDFVAEEQVVVEIKSIDQLRPIFDAQMLAYLRATGLHVGLVINFNAQRLADGIKRFVL